MLRPTEHRIRAIQQSADEPESGNILLLGLGIGLLVLALVIGLINVGNVHLERKRLTQLADTIALAYSDKLTVNSYYDVVDTAPASQKKRRDQASQDVHDLAQQLAISYGLSQVRIVELSAKEDHITAVVSSTKKRMFSTGAHSSATRNVTIYGQGFATNQSGSQ